MGKSKMCLGTCKDAPQILGNINGPNTLAPISQWPIIGVITQASSSSAGPNTLAHSLAHKETKNRTWGNVSLEDSHPVKVSSYGHAPPAIGSGGIK